MLLLNEYLKPSERPLNASNYLLFPYTDISTRFNKAELAEYALIRDATEKNDVLVVFGNDWNSETAFYTERKVVMFPSFPSGGFSEETLRQLQEERPAVSLYYQSVAEHIPSSCRILHQGDFFTAVTPALAGLSTPDSNADQTLAIE